MDIWRNQYFSTADLSDPAKESTVYGDYADAEPDGLENLIDWRRTKGMEMIARAEAIRVAFDDSRLEYHLISAGAYFAYIRHPFADPSLKVAERLAREFKIVCLPGTYFGAGQEPFFRFAFANLEEGKFPELIDRLVRSQA